ncbi:MAG: glycosyltransferase, partial [Candidatus Saccharibacteria bacterium]|nr:glycosyltransferase [Candidatus Saccharibacteria bacterium]
RATRIRTVSTRIARSLTALGIAAEKVTVLPLPLELDTFLAVGKKRSYGTPTTHRFVFVGRLALEKNLTVLLQAFADLYKTHKNVSLELVGKGPEHDKLMAHVAQLGLEQVVKFTPWSEEVATILAGADTFVLPSRHEGHAIVLLEAMAAGLPVVTTDVGCVGELVHDSVQGQVVLPTAPAITEAMTRYVSDPALHRRHAGAAYQTAQTIAARQESYLTEWKVTLMGE